MKVTTSSKKRSKEVFLIIACLYFIHVAFFGPQYKTYYSYNYDHQNAYRWQMVNSIPSKAPVIASFEFLSHLSSRKSLYSFHKIHDPYYQFAEFMVKSTLYTGSKFELPENVSHALINFEDFNIMYSIGLWPQLYFPKMQNFFMEWPWVVEKAAGNIVLFRKDAKGGVKLIEKTASDLSDLTNPLNIYIDGKFILASYEMKNPICEKEGTLIPFSFSWVSKSVTHHYYSLHFEITLPKSKIRTYNHLIGYTIYPTATWQNGEAYTENFWLPLSILKSGDYPLKVCIMDLNTEKKAVLETLNQNAAESDFMDLGKIHIP